jgi:hypothetical protein
MRPYVEKILHKKGLGGVAQGVGSEFKPHYCKNKEERKKKRKKEKKNYSK